MAASPSPSWRDAIRGNVLAVGLVSLLSDFASEMVNPILPLFLAGFVGAGAAPLLLGVIEGLADTTASLLKIISGRVSDRIGRRKPLVVVGYVLANAARPLIGLCTTGGQVVALKVVDRIGKGLRTSPRDALIGDAAPPALRGLAFSFHRAMDHSGAVIGPLCAALLLFLLLGRLVWRGAEGELGPSELDALRTVFLISAVPGALAVLAAIFGVREIPPTRPLASPRPDAPAGEADAPAGEADAPAGANPRPPRRAPLPRRFYAFVGVATVFALGNSSDLFLVLYAHERHGLGLGGVIGLWVVLHVAKILASLPGGVASDRLGRRPVLIAGWILYAAVYLGFALAPGPGALIALLVLYGVYYGLTEGAAKALVADLVESERRATAFGVYHGAIGLAALPASLLFGALWSAFGPIVALGVGSGLAFAASLGLLVLVRPAPGEQG